MSNIYNEIQNLYNMDKKTWQEVLAELYNLVANTNKKFDTFETKFGIMLGQEVVKEIKKMYEDGTLAEIINKEVFADLNNKIDEVKADILMTLTDYMGENNKKLEVINEQLDNKATYFESVNALKTSNKIKNNTICKTQGYYEAGDGGGAIYRITDNPALENAFSFSVAKGLTAELIYDDEINIKQLGARDYDENGTRVDIVPFIELYVSKTNNIGNSANTKMLKLFIPAGRWFSSPYKFKASSIFVFGVNGYSYPYATGTIILPIDNNQPYIWVVGDNTIDDLGREYGNINIMSLTFSTHNPSKLDGIYVGGLTNENAFTCEKLLTIGRCYGGIVDNIHFTNYIGTPLTITSSNELIFNDLTFRNGDSLENGNIVFDTDVTGSKNISACFFNKLSFEGVKGDLLSFKKDCKFINNYIGTIIFEDREVKISKNGTFRNYVISTDNTKTFTSKAIINIQEQDYCEIIIDNILLNNFGKVVFLLGASEYLFDTIVLKNGKVSKGQVNIKNISHTGARRNIMLLNECFYEGLGSYNFKFTCENARNIDTDTYKFIINTSGIMKPYIRYEEIGYLRCIDYVTSPNVLLSKNDKAGYYMPIVSDNDSLVKEKLVLDNLNYKKYLSTFSTEASCFIVPVLGNKLHIRANTKDGFVVHCSLIDNTGQKDYTIESKGEGYNWYTVDFTAYRQTHLDKEMSIALRTKTADETNYVKLDVFYWE